MKEVEWLLRQCTSVYEIPNRRPTAQNFGETKREVMLGAFWGDGLSKLEVTMNQYIA